MYDFIAGVPEGDITQLEVVESHIKSLEADSLASCQVQAFVFSNNHLQYVAERAFRWVFQKKSFILDTFGLMVELQTDSNLKL